MTLIRSTSALSAGVVLLLAPWSVAQEIQAEASVETPAEAEAAPAPEPAPEPVAEPEPEPEPEPVVVEEAPVEEPAADEEESTSGVSYLVFADAYASFQTAAPGSPSPSYRAYDSTVNYGNGAEVQDGFQLSWLGVDLNWDGGPVGATVNLRGGPGVNIYYYDTRMTGPISFTQAYVTWKPVENLSLDFGMFGTLFGAEVVENWANFNYTRSALYYQMQPFWHTGLRASYALSDEFSINGFIADDANQISLLDSSGGGNSTMQAALQVAYAGNGFSAALGTMQTLGENSLSGFDRFVDLVLGYSDDKFGILFNGDLNIGDNAATDYYGLSLAARYFFVPEFGIALRGDFLDLDMDVSDNEVVTGTLTFDYRPLKGADNLILRWDNRVEAATGQYTNRDGSPADAWFSSTIGVTAYTSGML